MLESPLVPDGSTPGTRAEVRPERPLTRRELRERETEAARLAASANEGIQAPAQFTGADAAAPAPWVQQQSHAPMPQAQSRPAWPTQPTAAVASETAVQPQVAQPAPARYASAQPAATSAQPAATSRPVHPSFDELFSGVNAPTSSHVAEAQPTRRRSTPATPIEAEPIDHPVARRSASVMSAAAEPAERPVAVRPQPAPATSEPAGFDDLFAGLGDDDADDLADTGRRSGRADRSARGDRKAEKQAKAGKGRFGAKARPEVHGVRRGAASAAAPAAAAAPASSAAPLAGGAATAAAAATASADFASLIAGAAAGPRTEPVVVQIPRPDVLAASTEIPLAPRGAVGQSDELAAMIAAAGAEADAFTADRRPRDNGPESHPAASARRASGASRATGRQAAVGARPAASASQPARPAQRRNRTRSIASVVAMGFAAMLAVATSVPSLSLLTPAEVQALALEGASTTTIDGQRVQINDGVLAQGVQSEGYKTQTIEEYAEAAGIRAEATFTNNPAGTVQWPFAVGVHIGDQFGYRDCAGCSSDHHGQDFNPGYGADIQSIADGVVVESTDSGGSLGTVIMIQHEIDGQTIVSVYAHMIEGSRLFEIGDTVEVGDVIGETGNTGMSTGPHLHFEIRIGGMDGEWVDPLQWLYANTN
ncbi:peptidoglycan DD-metalloendopeptidase family protein [Agromyces sp. NPDC058126]|uniref:peptidoglycan DD-metalloendopeptidase family protein n=1 Tax=Agromyces sp. NPDC058126 TaxID=3346350 RepID=UPI0036D866B2